MKLTRRTALMATLAAAATSWSATGWAKADKEGEAFFIRLPDGRQIPTYRWDPRGRQKGFILFSHGANSAPRHYKQMINAWTKAGYTVMAPLHVDSAEHPLTKSFPGLTTWRARIEDMRALARAIKGKPYIAAGHSYGGLTALALGGAVGKIPEGLTGDLHDPAAKLVLAYSPPANIPDMMGETGYQAVKVPMLLQTGTKDYPAMPNIPADAWKGHLDAFNAALAGSPSYGIVLKDVDHYYGGLICRADVPGPHQQAELDRTLKLSDLFLKAYDRNSKSALRELAEFQPVAGDEWLRK